MLRRRGALILVMVCSLVALQAAELFADAEQKIRPPNICARQLPEKSFDKIAGLGYVLGLRIAAVMTRFYNGTGAGLATIGGVGMFWQAAYSPHGRCFGRRLRTSRTDAIRPRQGGN